VGNDDNEDETTTATGGGLTTSPATERAPRRRRGGQEMRRALTWHFVILFHCCLLNLIITSSYLFYYHLSSSAEYFVSVHRRPLASAADTSVDRHCSPSSTAIAQCSRSPWPFPEAGVRPLCPSSTSSALLPLPSNWRRPGDDRELPDRFLLLVVAMPRATPPPALLCRNGRHRCSRTIFNGLLLCVFYHLYTI
jgi:hypothetical protein